MVGWRRAVNREKTGPGLDHAKILCNLMPHEAQKPCPSAPIKILLIN